MSDEFEDILDLVALLMVMRIGASFLRLLVDCNTTSAAVPAPESSDCVTDVL